MFSARCITRHHFQTDNIQHQERQLEDACPLEQPIEPEIRPGDSVDDIVAPATLVAPPQAVVHIEANFDSMAADDSSDGSSGQHVLIIN